MSLKSAHYGEKGEEWEAWLVSPQATGMKAMEGMSLTNVRSAMEQMEAGIPDPYPGVSFKDHKINNDGVTARVFRRKDLESLTSTDGTKAPLFLIFHGGGFSLGSHYTEVVLIKVATSLGFVVVSIDYRRVPESRFPGPFDDCFEGLLWTIKNGSRFGGDVSKIFIGGSSAGANLATAVTLKARDEAMKEIKGQILLIPNTCHYRYHPKDKYELESLHSEGDQLGISGEAIKYIWDEYAPDQGANPYVSPLLAESHANLPPTYIQVAGGDVLRDEGIAYAEALKAAGVKVKLDVYPGVPHLFLLEPAGLPSTTKSKNDVTEAIKSMLASTEQSVTPGSQR